MGHVLLDMSSRIGRLLYGLKPLYKIYAGLALSLTSRFPIGTNVFERDWDALILLDTCRVDALREVAHEYDFLENIGSIISVGSTSSEWIAQTFTKKFETEIHQTAYVSGNGWAEKVIEERVMPEEHIGSKYAYTSWDTVWEEDFLVLDQAWRYEPEPRFDHGLGHPHPRFVTDRAISITREYKPKRLIVHYSQPHSPYTSAAIDEGRELRPSEKRPLIWLRKGGDQEIVWEAYLDHLRFVLDDLELLLENIDMEKVVISADHGEAFGKWLVYGHGPVLPHPHVKIVPWAVTSGRDEGEYDPDIDSSEPHQRNVDEQLNALGYK